MPSPSLSNESIALLRVFMKNTSLPSKQLAGYSEPCIEQLSDAGFIESHAIGYNNSRPGAIAFPIYSDYAITEAGKAYIENLDRRIHEKRWENVRYAITTAIALAAFIKSFFF